jgi:hypothetical protein
MKGDEALVVRAFTAHLEEEGWQVRLGSQFEADLYATNSRDGSRLVVEAKGAAGSSSGTAIDILYGQLLRRMIEEDDPSTRYGAVVRDDPQGVSAVLRVPMWVRDRLRIDVYAVGTDGLTRRLP